MACCKPCCGCADCTEGQEGKCCCGGAAGTCCPPGEFCCSGVCTPGGCCSGACDAENPCPPGCACVDGVCVPEQLGACCEYFCEPCGYCNYQWDGTQYSYINGVLTACPTTGCQFAECPESGAAIGFPSYLEGVDFLAYSACCQYPDSYFTCTETTSENCEGVWASGVICPETYEAMEAQCDAQMFP